MIRSLRSWNLWIAIGLLSINALAWLSVPPAWELIEVEPLLHPEIAAVRDKVNAGQASGETFHVVVTDEIAAQAIAWVLARRPEIPFSHPWVEFDPQGATGRGLAHVLGLRTPVEGRVGIALRDGVPVVTIQDLGVAGVMAPGVVVNAVRGEAEALLDFENRSLPVVITRLELGEGMLTVEGIYK